MLLTKTMYKTQGFSWFPPLYKGTLKANKKLKKTKDIKRPFFLFRSSAQGSLGTLLQLGLLHLLVVRVVVLRFHFGLNGLSGLSEDSGVRKRKHRVGELERCKKSSESWGLKFQSLSYISSQGKTHRPYLTLGQLTTSFVRLLDGQCIYKDDNTKT